MIIIFLKFLQSYSSTVLNLYTQVLICNTPKFVERNCFALRCSLVGDWHRHYRTVMLCSGFMPAFSSIHTLLNVLCLHVRTVLWVSCLTLVAHSDVSKRPDRFYLAALTLLLTLYSRNFCQSAHSTLLYVVYLNGLSLLLFARLQFQGSYKVIGSIYQKNSKATLAIRPGISLYWNWSFPQALHLSW